MSTPDEHADHGLRERIARALYDRVTRGVRGPWDSECRGIKDMYLADADAVIEALGLREKFRVDMGYAGDEIHDIRADAEQHMAEIAKDWGDDPPDQAAALWICYTTDWSITDWKAAE